MFVGRWWYFLEKCWKTGWSEQDVRDRRMLPWMATGAVPVRIRTSTHFSSENSHGETLHRGRMFRSPWAFVRSTATLRYEPCTQFINVSQRTLHIYFIDGCRVCPLDAQYKNRTKQPLVWASSHRGIPFYFCMARNFQFYKGLWCYTILNPFAFRQISTSSGSAVCRIMTGVEESRLKDR